MGAYRIWLPTTAIGYKKALGESLLDPVQDNDAGARSVGPLLIFHFVCMMPRLLVQSPPGAQVESNRMKTILVHFTFVAIFMFFVLLAAEEAEGKRMGAGIKIFLRKKFFS